MTTKRLPLWERALYAIPLFGWMLKDVVYGDKDNIWYFLFSLGCMWIFAMMYWGIAAFVLPFALATPFLLLFLIILTRG